MGGGGLGGSIPQIPRAPTVVRKKGDGGRGERGGKCIFHQTRKEEP